MGKLLEVLDGKSFNTPPFWFMRQAGRYMPEYMAMRNEAGSFLALCGNPKWAAEVTMQPIHAFDMDAAIIFADILLIPMALGVPLKFVQGEGPKLGEFKTSKIKYNNSELDYVFEALERTRGQLDKSKDLIGFAGSPWTVATYMIEGGSSQDYPKARAMLNTSEFDDIIEILIHSTAEYLTSQLDAGADCVKLFDSWASALTGADFDKYITEPNRKIIELVREKKPDAKFIAFPRKCGDKIESFANNVPANCIAFDEDISFEKAISLPQAVQGNLAPQILLGSKSEIESKATEILEAMQDKPFIFNLAHGINKETPVENVAFLSKIIKNSK